ncbi:MAG TPA: helix-turn-helix transcriptional regulator [Telluria sp.]|jgi:transcriptional regulator with XRE-family HTH domain
MTLAEILAKNLSTLMAITGLDTDDKVARRSGVGRGTVDRLRKAEVSARLETVEALAKGFGISGIYLLTDHIKPDAAAEAMTVRQREWLALLDYLGSEDITEFGDAIRKRQQKNALLLAELGQPACSTANK